MRYTRLLTALASFIALVIGSPATADKIRCLYGDNVTVEQTEAAPQAEFQMRINGIVSPYAYSKPSAPVTNILTVHTGDETILRFQGSFPQGTYHFGWWIDDCSLTFHPETISQSWFETTLLATPCLIPSFDEVGGQIFANFKNPGSGKVELVRAGYVDRPGKYPIEALGPDSLPASSLTLFASGLEIPAGDSSVTFVANQGALDTNAVLYVEAVFNPVTAYGGTTRVWTAHAPPSPDSPAPMAGRTAMILLGLALVLGSVAVLVRRRRLMSESS